METNDNSTGVNHGESFFFDSNQIQDSHFIPSQNNFKEDGSIVHQDIHQMVTNQDNTDHFDVISNENDTNDDDVKDSQDEDSTQPIDENNLDNVQQQDISQLGGDGLDNNIDDIDQEESIDEPNSIPLPGPHMQMIAIPPIVNIPGEMRHPYPFFPLGSLAQIPHPFNPHNFNPHPFPLMNAIPIHPGMVPQSLNQNSHINPQSPPDGLGQGNSESKYIDITPFLDLPQSESAKKLNIPTSTLSKRWKEAVRGRKWPYRSVCKLDKEIMTLLHNIPHDMNYKDRLPPDIERDLVDLLRKRQEELKPVIIRL